MLIKLKGKRLSWSHYIIIQFVSKLTWFLLSMNWGSNELTTLVIQSTDSAFDISSVGIIGISPKWKTLFSEQKQWNNSKWYKQSGLIQKIVHNVATYYSTIKSLEREVILELKLSWASQRGEVTPIVKMNLFVIARNWGVPILKRVNGAV